MTRLSSFVLPLVLVSAAISGEVTVQTDDETGWREYTLSQGATVAHVVPEAGCNVYSIRVDGTEYFRSPTQLKDLPGVGYGNPVLYPTPNRVRGAQFRFQGKSYKFQPNNRGNFIHGLVHSTAWRVASSRADADVAQIRCELPFQPGTQHYELFPLAHVFRLTITVKDGSVRWTYEVDNREGKQAVPFGVAFHPYFVYQGQRGDTYLQVPATHVMESMELLPTGKLLELSGTKYDLRAGASLKEFVLDDVFFGMSDKRPARIDFRDVKRRVTLRASPEFTHLVVYTPRRPYFCVENQTCSTDAHNLHDQGQRGVAHLQICPSGETMTGWAEYAFGSYD